MSGLDAATWQALGLLLTLLGLGTSFVVWSRRGPARGLRAVAWSLIPLAAALTGTLRLAADVVGAVTRWSSRLVFDPLTWTGIAVAGVAAVLFVVSGRLLRRDPSPRTSRRGARAAAAADPAGRPGTAGAVGSRAGAPPATPPGAAAGSAAGSASSRAGSGTGDPEMDEIEAILRRRGIT